MPNANGKRQESAYGESAYGGMFMGLVNMHFVWLSSLSVRERWFAGFKSLPEKPLF
ncbi:hypothetical protein [Bartonella machadoae]|uniref:hypothetical protein n=1 Tax=Bartonella machadoae TaxID=2893471 RepID=UPI001F4CC1FC|nr:hypothetical protein [Bartonella machadoae]UNE53956.1 hypothetical protein LNM86_10295 [Bartonella machadoae]